MTREEFEIRFVYDPQKDRIGGGGFGTVYKGYDSLRKRFIAIKEQQVKEHQFTLQKEVELCNEIEKHDNILAYENCYRFSVMRGVEVDFATMKYYEDGSVDTLLKNRILSDAQKDNLIKGILLGIRHLHKEGIIHRDLKTANILIDRDKNNYIPKIADFGLSRLTGGEDRSSISNSAIGKTIAYAAPEQIKGQTIKKNVDLWAFGVIAYKILTGNLPFMANEGVDFATAQIDISKKILSLELPPKLNSIKEPYQSIIRKCWVLDANERVQSADDLLYFWENWANKNSERYEDETTLIEIPPKTSNEDETTFLEETLKYPANKTQVNTSSLPSQKLLQEEATLIEDFTQANMGEGRGKEKKRQKKLLNWTLGGVAVLILFSGGIIYYNKVSKNILPNDLSPANSSEDTTRLPSVMPNKDEGKQNLESNSKEKKIANVPDNVSSKQKEKQINTEPATNSTSSNDEAVKKSISSLLTFTDIDGDIVKYEGENNGKANGRGIGKYQNGDVYEGEYKENKRHGYGTYTEAGTNTKYTGAWANDRPNGKGKLILGRKTIPACPNAAQMEGNYISGQENGIFKVWDKQNKLIYEGLIVNGLPKEPYPNK